ADEEVPRHLTHFGRVPADRSEGTIKLRAHQACPQIALTAMKCLFEVIASRWEGVAVRKRARSPPSLIVVASTHDLLFVARTLERAGDHVTNIAERIILIATGRRVRASELRKVVEQPSENAPEISLEAARRLGHDDAKIGDEIWVEIAPEE
ncbi:PhoU domain-containing protein, partial [Acetomicrobium sp. S15 = DSM 107314]|uniref:PhoU domain-containing protein n=1 Tax=Acetomicrobium sp. S15 = DSM 107314 TaxID=2529858 RepID=UPI00237CD8D6